MNPNTRNFWDSPATPQGGGFWDTPVQPTSSPSNKIARMGVEDQKKKIARLQEEARVAQEESRRANSFWSRGVEPVLEGFSDFAGKPFFKAVAVGSSALMGKSYTPKTGFQKELVGSQGPINLTTQGNELGIKNPVVAPVAGALITALDVNPLTSGKGKAAAEVSKDTASYLAKLTRAKEVSENAGEATGLVNKGKALLSKIKTKTVDLAAPIEDTLSAALKKNKLSLLPEDDVSNQISKVFRAPSLANQFMEDNGLKAVIKSIDNPDYFDQYLIAKQAIDVDTRGIKTGRDLVMDAQLVKELAPQYEEAAQKVYQYSRTILDKSVADGLISSDLATRLKQMYPNYVPLNRVFSALEETSKFGSKGLASNSTQSVVRALKGSDREIESPIKSIYQKTLDVFSQGEKNRAAQILTSYHKLPGNPFNLRPLLTEDMVKSRKSILGKLYEDFSQKRSALRLLKTDSKELAKLTSRIEDGERQLAEIVDEALSTDVDEQFKAASALIEKSLKLEGRINGILESNKYLVTSRNVKQLTELIEERSSNIAELRRALPDTFKRSKDAGEHTISVLRNGVRETWVAPKEIAEAAKALNAQQLGVVLRAISVPVRIARLGLTALNPAFVAANLARDQVTAYINTQHALSVFNPVNMTRALFAAAGHGNLYDEAVRSGALGTSYDIARDAAPATIDRIRATRSAASFAWHNIKHPGDLVREIENLFSRTEEMTRLQVFSGTKKALMAKGVAEDTARIQAARAAREGTVDFARRGEYGTVLNSIWLYLNANIQGVRTLLRTVKERPAETLAKIAVAGVVPVVTTTLYNLSDPERKKIYQDIPEWEKDNNLIFISPGAEYNEETRRWDGVWKIPMSQEIRSLMQLPRRIVEATHDLDPVRAGDVAQSLIGTVSPIGSSPREIMSFGIPQAVKPTIQATTNYDFFTGAPIVPESMQGLPEELQTRDDTSGLAKGIGGALDVSPIKVEKFAKDTFGSLSDIVFGKNVGEKIGQRFVNAAGGAETNKEFEGLNEAITNQKGDRFRAKKKAEETLEELRAIAEEQGEETAQAVFQQMIAEDPDLAEGVAEAAQEESLGLTSVEKAIKQLGVENGERAKYIWRKIQALGTPEEKEAYVQNLIQKKIVSKTVAAQINELMKQDE